MLSNILTINFLELVKNNLPSRIIISDARLQQVINNAITRYASFYIDNDLGIFDSVDEIDFFNASQNDFINSRDLTRWVGISPVGFRASKLLSCTLKEANPDIIEYPAGIAYIQDIEISISDSDTVNSSTPEANTGLCSLRGSDKLFNVLTLGSANSWTNLHSITALLSYYRMPVLPTWDPLVTTETVDVLVKDFSLVINYIIESILGRNTPAEVKRAIYVKESELLY
jgi:hypothetical protein